MAALIPEFPERLMQKGLVMSLVGNDTLEQEALMNWLHFVQSEASREAKLGEMDQRSMSWQSISSCLRAEQELGAELTKLLQPADQGLDCDEGSMFSAKSSSSAENVDGKARLIKGEEGEEAEAKKESKRISSMLSEFSSGLSQGTIATLHEFHQHSGAIHVELDRSEAEADCVASKIIQPYCFDGTPRIVGIMQPSANSERMCVEQLEVKVYNADTEMKGFKEHADQASHRRDDEEGAEEEYCSISRKQPLISSTFQFIESRFTRPTSCSTPQSTVCHLRSISQSSSPVSVCQGRWKLSATPVRPMVGGNSCRRRLFGKRINADDVATSSHVHGAQKRARIEDYVDSFLLAEATQKVRLSLSKQVDAARNSSDCLQVNSDGAENGRNGFNWPSAELHAMVVSAPADWHWCQLDSDAAKGSSTFDWPSEELHAMTVSRSRDF
ncbi:hypothetical protein GOP47_0029375 [Adiantum capillus-veneris]|nr:hypothetical protein GOP47_0029375 [Adiantum capillus-veneris]